MSEHIRWEQAAIGGGFAGSASTGGSWLFQISRPGESGPWVLNAISIPPLSGLTWRGDDPEQLKMQAERLLREYAASLGAIFPEPGTRSYVHWAVAYGCPSGDPNEAAGILEYDDEADAREHLQWVHDSFLARRTVTSTRWERVEAGTPAPEGER